MSSSGIQQGLIKVRERIVRAARIACRDPSEITLLAVTKAQSAQAVREAYEAGQRDFGENYVQELVAKSDELSDLEGIRWHMIGHLQTNKAKMVVERVVMVQSVDSARLADELGRRAVQMGKVLDVLVEVNIGAEQSKTGVAEPGAHELVEHIAGLAGLRLRGLMTVPPFSLEAHETAVHFDRLAVLALQWGGRERLVELSMGMSHDFEQAIEKGATIVRVGTAIFGDRS